MRRFLLYASIPVSILMIISFLSLIHFYHVHWYEPKRPKTGSPFTEGYKVIDALDKFRKCKGQYPPQLDSLVPEYLDSIPIPEWGTRRWGYAVTNSGYALSVRLKEDDYICHIYQNGNWQYDQ